MSTMLCSWRLCPSPGMYAVTSMPLTSRTRATLRSAEFGFLGVVVYTRVHTPRFCGLSRMAGDLLFWSSVSRPLRTSWLIVGIRVLKPWETKKLSEGHQASAVANEKVPRQTEKRNALTAPCQPCGRGQNAGAAGRIPGLPG